MKSRVLIGTLLLASISMLPAPAHAGIYGDDLSKCLIKNTSAEDKSSLVQWMFFAMALNPNVASLAAIPEAKRVETDKKTAALFMRLLTESCAVETQAAVKYEGSGAIAESFKLLGEVATQEMMTDPAVAKGVTTFAQYLDEHRLNEIFGKPGK